MRRARRRMRWRIGWDISHMEFTIEDHYYFSLLKRKILSLGASVEEVEALEDILSYDVLVINYPEMPFNDADVGRIVRYLEGGGRVVILGYFRNEDNVADNINSLTKRFGLELLNDEIFDDHHNHEGDERIIVSSKVMLFSDGVRRVLMPCPAPIRPLSSDARIVLEAENTARTLSGHRPIMGALVGVGKGFVLLLGSCVFWDNFSIRKYDNMRFAANILLWKT